MGIKFTVGLLSAVFNLKSFTKSWLTASGLHMSTSPFY